MAPHRLATVVHIPRRSQTKTTTNTRLPQPEDLAERSCPYGDYITPFVDLWEIDLFGNNCLPYKGVAFRTRHGALRRYTAAEAGG